MRDVRLYFNMGVTAMSDKLKAVPFPVSSNDFYKTNGVDATFRPVGPSMARQEFAEECDINNLMARYSAHAGTGPNFLPALPGDPAEMFYADFTTLPKSLMEFHEQMNAAQSAFMTLPAGVRKEMDNDPVRFVDFASDPSNLEKMREWGLAPPAKPEKAAPVEVRVVPEAKDQEPPKGSQSPPTHGST